MNLDELKHQIEGLDPNTHRTLRNSLIARYYQLAGNQGQGREGHTWQECDVSRNRYVARDINPRLLHKTVADRIIQTVQGYERQSACTWAEIIGAIRLKIPEPIERYYETYAKIDCDIYGKWKTEKIGKDDELDFQYNLHSWEAIVYNLIELHRNLQKIK